MGVNAGSTRGIYNIPSCVWEKRKSSLQKEGFYIYVKVGINVHSGKTIPFAMREGISQMLLVKGGGVEVGE